MLHSLHVVGLPLAMITLLVMFHHLNIILNAFELLLEEALFLPNRLYFKSIAEQRIQMLLVLATCIVEYVYHVWIVHCLRTLVSVAKILVPVVCDWRHGIL